jgi:hypothetical protein
MTARAEGWYTSAWFAPELLEGWRPYPEFIGPIEPPVWQMSRRYRVWKIPMGHPIVNLDQCV